MKSKITKKKTALVCVAHPDDESIYFSGLILRNKWDWTVVCVTDGNADGMGSQRHQQFLKACRTLKVRKAIQWDLKDQFNQRLKVAEITERLSQLKDFDVVFTHGPLGEYGHPHHQDVSFTVHQYYHKKCPVYSVAQSVYPDFKVNLDIRQFKLKTKILTDIYRTETERFLNLIPISSQEGFVKVSWEEVKEIYEFILDPGYPIQKRKKALVVYQRLYEYLLSRKFFLSSRVF